jgi:hypothetical protein
MVIPPNMAALCYGRTGCHTFAPIVPQNLRMCLISLKIYFSIYFSAHSPFKNTLTRVFYAIPLVKRHAGVYNN